MAYIVGLMFKGDHRAIIPALEAQMAYVVGLLFKASCLPSAGLARTSDNLRRWSGVLVGSERDLGENNMDIRQESNRDFSEWWYCHFGGKSKGARCYQKNSKRRRKGSVTEKERGALASSHLIASGPVTTEFVPPIFILCGFT
ncbi:hypothetical protein RUND412_007286 [Rhizina undulata]